MCMESPIVRCGSRMMSGGLRWKSSWSRWDLEDRVAMPKGRGSNRRRHGGPGRRVPPAGVASGPLPRSLVLDVEAKTADLEPCDRCGSNDLFTLWSGQLGGVFPVVTECAGCGVPRVMWERESAGLN